MGSHVRIAAVAGLSLLALAPAGAASRSEVAPAWQTHALARGGSISLPSTWRNFTRQTPQLHAAIQAEVIRNPRLAPVLDALRARRSPLVRFLAADFARASLRSGWVTSVNVLAQRTNGTLDQWAATNVAALRRLRAVPSPIRRSTAMLPAGRAVHLRYTQRVQTGTPVKRVAVTQYAVARNRTIYLVTFTTRPTQVASYRAAFERSARTLRLR